MITVWNVLEDIGAALLVLYLGYSLLALVSYRRKHPLGTMGSEAPGVPIQFTVLIPALNESRVIGATLANLRAVAPEAQLVVIDDASDDQTAAIVAAAAQRDPDIRLLRRTLPAARTGKGEALNWAVRQLVAELDQRPGGDRPAAEQVLVIFDADGRLDPGLLPEARRAFADPSVMAAQARIRVRQQPGGLLARLLLLQQDMEFYIVRHIQLLRERFHTVGLGGNGQFMRLSSVRAQLREGRDPWPPVLLEDFASGLEIRLASPLHRLVFLESGVTQQGLTNVGRFVRQRARWTQGNLQCVSSLRRIWSTPMPLGARLDLTYFLAQPWLNTVALALLVYYPVRAAQRVMAQQIDWPSTLLLTLLNLSIPLAWVLLYRHENRLGLRRTLFATAGLPVYMLIMMLSVPLAFRNHLGGRTGWVKSARSLES